MRHRAFPVALDLALLWTWSVVFTFLPSWLSGIPARNLLSSDAEYYAAVTQRLIGSTTPTVDAALATDLLPVSEQAFLITLADIARAVHVELLDAWVVYELIAAMLFAAALYWLLIDVTRSRRISVIAAVVLSLGVHALGGSVFGFEPRGFIPRDLALGVAVVVVKLHTHAGSDRQKAAIFLTCGILANAYSVLFAHLVGVLLLVELARRPRSAPTVVGFAVLAILGAAPTVVDVLATRIVTAPPDPDIYRLRASYVLVTPLSATVVQYLRRPLLAFAAILALFVLCRGRWTSDERARLMPFFAIAIAAAAVAATGVALEQGTPLARLLASRASVFLILASVPLSLVGAPLALRGRISNHGLVGVGLAFAFLAIQSNVLTDVRSITSGLETREERLDLLRAATELRLETADGDVFMAPSSDAQDVAAALRTYAGRPAFVTYKDLGIVFYDGARARDLFDRWMQSEIALGSDRQVLMDFMAAHGVRAAVVKSGTHYEVVVR